MTVQKILQSKGTNEVVTVPPGTPLTEVAQVLSTRRIGTVVVSPDGEKVLGILSERDIVRELGKRGVGCMTEAVDALMTRDVQTCVRSDPADDILNRMTMGRFRHMPVVEDGKLIGLITIGDVVKMRLAEVKMEKDALEGMIMGH